MILTYFNLYAKAEPIRMALTHSKTAFTDNRVTGQAWLDFKASGKCNNGQVWLLLPFTMLERAWLLDLAVSCKWSVRIRA